MSTYHFYQPFHGPACAACPAHAKARMLGVPGNRAVWCDFCEEEAEQALAEQREHGKCPGCGTWLDEYDTGACTDCIDAQQARNYSAGRS